MRRPIEVGLSDATRAEVDRHLHHAAGAMNIRPVDDGVDRQRDAGIDDPPRHLKLAGEGALVAGDAIGARFLAVLNRQLQVIEPRFGQTRHGGLAQAYA